MCADISPIILYHEELQKLNAVLCVSNGIIDAPPDACLAFGKSLAIVNASLISYLGLRCSVAVNSDEAWADIFPMLEKINPYTAHKANNDRPHGQILTGFDVGVKLDNPLEKSAIASASPENVQLLLSHQHGYFAAAEIAMSRSIPEEFRDEPTNELAAAASGYKEYWWARWMKNMVAKGRQTTALAMRSLPLHVLGVKEAQGPGGPKFEFVTN